LYQVITHTNKAISLVYISLVRPNFEYGASRGKVRSTR